MARGWEMRCQRRTSGEAVLLTTGWRIGQRGWWWLRWAAQLAAALVPPVLPWLAKQMKTTVALWEALGMLHVQALSWEPVRRTVLLADHSHWPGHGQERAATTDSSSARPCPKTRTQATAPSWVTFIDARRHTEVHQPPACPEQASSSPCAWTLTLAPTAPSYSWFTDSLHNREITPSTTVSYLWRWSKSRGTVGNLFPNCPSTPSIEKYQFQQCRATASALCWPCCSQPFVEDASKT